MAKKGSKYPHLSWLGNTFASKKWLLLSDYWPTDFLLVILTVNNHGSGVSISDPAWILSTASVVTVTGLASVFLPVVSYFGFKLVNLSHVQNSCRSTIALSPFKAVLLWDLISHNSASSGNRAEVVAAAAEQPLSGVHSEDPECDKCATSPRGVNDRPLLQHKDSRVADRAAK